MSNNLGQNDANNIQKPYEPDVIKGLTASNAPTKPVAPPPPPPNEKKSDGQ